MSNPLDIRIPHVGAYLIPAIAAALLFAGCTGSAPSDSTAETDSSHAAGSTGHHDHGHADHEGHAHAAKGPHHGTLVELGDEAYHAEVVHDEESGQVVIYLLDSAAKSAVPIDAAEVAINLRHGNKREQFKLAASPVAGDPPGTASRFISSDKELAEDLDHADADTHLVVTIVGKQYRGKIAHAQDHGDTHRH